MDELLVYREQCYLFLIFFMMIRPSFITSDNTWEYLFVLYAETKRLFAEIFHIYLMATVVNLWKEVISVGKCSFRKKQTMIDAIHKYSYTGVSQNRISPDSI